MKPKEQKRLYALYRENRIALHFANVKCIMLSGGVARLSGSATLRTGVAGWPHGTNKKTHDQESDTGSLLHFARIRPKPGG